MATTRELDQPLGFSQKLAYGAGDFGAAVTANLLAFFFLYFLTNVAGLEAGLAGAVLMVGKAWDAINDPLVGWLSDRTQSRLGRRLPWMIWGAAPFALTFALHWLVPGGDRWFKFGFYVVVSVLFNNFFTAVNLPYTALGAELTQNYDERTQLTGFRFTFSIGGSILSLVLAQVIFAAFQPAAGSCQNDALPYTVLGGVCGLLSLLTTAWCVLGIRQRVWHLEARRQEQPVEAPLPIAAQVRAVLRNRPFLFVIGIYFCSWLSVQVTAAVIPYFVTNWMGLPEQDFINVTLAVQGTALLLLFGWSQVSARLGKRFAYFAGAGLWLVAQGGLFFLQPGQVVWLYILAVMAGAGVSVAYLIPWSMVPDTIELDELETGQRREGIFYAFMVLLQKVGLAIALFALGLGLEAAGFAERVPCQPLPVQPDSALQAIRWAIGPLPALALIGSLILTYFYPIDREFHQALCQKLAERRSDRIDSPH